MNPVTVGTGCFIKLGCFIGTKLNRLSMEAPHIGFIYLFDNAVVRHKLFIVGNKQQLRKMTEIAARKRKRDPEASLAEKEAPKDFVANLLEYVEEHGSVISINPRHLKQDWGGISLQAEIGPTKKRSASNTRQKRSRRRR